MYSGRVPNLELDGSNPACVHNFELDSSNLASIENPHNVGQPFSSPIFCFFLMKLLGSLNM